MQKTCTARYDSNPRTYEDQTLDLVTFILALATLAPCLPALGVLEGAVVTLSSTCCIRGCGVGKKELWNSMEFLRFVLGARNHGNPPVPSGITFIYIILLYYIKNYSKGCHDYRTPRYDVQKRLEAHENDSTEQIHSILLLTSGSSEVKPPSLPQLWKTWNTSILPVKDHDIPFPLGYITKMFLLRMYLSNN